MEQIVSAVMDAVHRAGLVEVEVSARHVHLSQADVEVLFGPGARLEPKRPLSQPGQFLSEQRVTLVGPKGRKERVAVLGPARKATQVELSKSDCMELGVKAPVRESGDVAGSGAITIEGPCGTLELKEGVIIALLRHVGAEGGRDHRPQPHPRHRAGLQAAGSERQAAGVRGRDERAARDFPGCHHPGEHGVQL